MSAGGRSKGVSDSYWAVAARRLAGANVGSLSPMTEMGQSRRFGDVRATSALPPIATRQRTSLEVRFVPILLQKSFWGVELKFLEPLMRFARGDVRDHIG